MSGIPTSTPKWLRLICVHNPFYMVSACLILYGLHISFHVSAGVEPGWQLMSWLGGYATLLLLVATLIVRTGQVWEDARTILLLIVLIVIAISASFDRACLDGPMTGAKFLAVGLGIAMTLAELTLPCLSIRLPLHYRLPLYSQLILLFAYPVWLAHLSVTDQEPRMTWYVMLFCCFAAITILLLIPAAIRGGRGEPANGTPWSWPWYPWPLFVAVAIGMAVRAFGLSVSFELSKGLSAGFQVYTLVPLVCALLVVGFESCRRYRYAATVCCLAGTSLLLLVWPGTRGNEAQQYMLEMLVHNAGSPAQLTGWLLVVFYAYCWLRGNRTAEPLLVGTLFFTAFVDAHSVNLSSLTTPDQRWVVAGIGLLVVRGSFLGSSTRLITAIVVGMVDLYHLYGHTSFGVGHGYYPLHLGLVAILALGLVMDDRCARRIRSTSHLLIMGGSFAGVVGYRFVFPEIPTIAHVGYLGVLATLAICYWWKDRAPTRLLAAAVSVGSTLVLGCEAVLRLFPGNGQLLGRRWIVSGWLALILATMISLVKGGVVPKLRIALTRCNARLQRRQSPPT